MTRRPSTLATAVLAATALLAGVASVAHGAPAPAAPARPALAPAGSGWLAVVNDVRRSSGLAAVTEQPAWTAGIKAHLRYLRLTSPRLRTGAYASVHTENPASPYYSAAGRAAGASSDLILGATSSDRAAIERWLAGPLHAIGMLRPGLTRVAFYRDPAGGAGIDILRGLAAVPTRRTPVLFPGPGATTNLTRYGAEVPDPLRSCGWTRAGLPLIALLPSIPAAGTSAQLVRPDGTRVTSAQRGHLCVVTERTFATTDTVYGATGRAIMAQDHVVLVVPAAPLTAGRYTVRIAQPGRSPIAWSFTVVGADRTPPVVRLLSPRATTTTASTVSVRWRGTDRVGKIRYYLVQRSVRPAGRTTAVWRDLGGRRLSPSLVAATGSRGTTTCFRVKAVDRAGNVSRWSNARCLVRR